jgi:hypothetical protein
MGQNMKNILLLVAFFIVPTTIFALGENTLEDLKKKISEDPCTECLNLRSIDVEKQPEATRSFFTQFKSIDAELIEASTQILKKADAVETKDFTLRVDVTKEYITAIRKFIADETKQEAIVAVYVTAMTKLDNQCTLKSSTSIN